MKSYLRFLSRNKLYTAIEVVSLSIALAFTIPVLSFVTNNLETKYSYKDYKMTFTLTAGRGIQSSLGVGSYLKESIPEITKVSSADMVNAHYKDGTLEFTVFRCDSAFFDFFPIKFIYGDASFINTPSHICVSERFAERLKEDGAPVIGRELVIDDKSFMIAAIMENQGRGLIRYSDVIRKLTDNEGARGLHPNYVTMLSVSDTTGLQEKIQSACSTYYTGFESGRQYGLLRYDDILNYPEQIAFALRPVAVTAIFFIICLILLTIALLGSCNLIVALATKRTREFATRKLVGAESGSIYRSIFMESAVLTSCAFIFALPLSGIITPFLDSIMKTFSLPIDNLTIDFNALCVSGYLIIAILVVVILSLSQIGIINSSAPIDITKGVFGHYTLRKMSKSFICIQIVLALLATCFSIFFKEEFRHYMNMETNCDIEDVFVLTKTDTDTFPYEAMLSKLDGCPEVTATGLSVGFPQEAHQNIIIPNGDGSYAFLYYITCDTEAFDLFGFEEIDRYRGDNHGLWMSKEALKDTEIYPELFTRLTEETGTADITGHIENFPAIAGNLSSSGVIVVSDREKVRQMDNVTIAIKTIPNHKQAVSAILKCYNEVTGSMLSDIRLQNFGGYLVEDFIDHYYGDRKDFADKMQTVSAILFFMIFISLFGISIYFTSEQKLQVAIRKVYGAAPADETKRLLKQYLKLTLIANAIAIPMVIIIVSLISVMGDYGYNLARICIPAIVLSFVISILSVYPQVLQSSRTNPADALKKE